jgi:hypothetical protein
LVWASGLLWANGLAKGAMKSLCLTVTAVGSKRKQPWAWWMVWRGNWESLRSWAEQRHTTLLRRASKNCGTGTVVREAIVRRCGRRSHEPTPTVDNFAFACIWPGIRYHYGVANALASGFERTSVDVRRPPIEPHVIKPVPVVACRLSPFFFAQPSAVSVRTHRGSWCCEPPGGEHAQHSRWERRRRRPPRVE